MQAAFLYWSEQLFLHTGDGSAIVYFYLFCVNLSIGIKNFYAYGQILISASELFLLKYSQVQFTECIF